MYSEKDTLDAAAKQKKFILLFSTAAAILIGLIVADQFWRLLWLSYVAAGLLAVASIFLWGTIGIRLYCWRRFLRDMNAGLERTVNGVIGSIEEDETTKEGIEFRALRLLTGDESDKAGGRILYVDASRFPLKAHVGQNVACRIFGNYVKEIEILEER